MIMIQIQRTPIEMIVVLGVAILMAVAYPPIMIISIIIIAWYLWNLMVVEPTTPTCEPIIPREPQVGDTVDDYIYGTGVTLTGKIVAIEGTKITISAMTNDITKFQTMIAGDPGVFPTQTVERDELCQTSYGWTLDSFL